MKNLAITGGNKGYYEYLKPFITSLRKHNKNTKIVVCDNTIEGKWNNPGTFKSGGSFEEEQILFFKENDVKIEIFSELMEEFNFDKSLFKKIKTGHWAYPAKYIYCYLIALKYKTDISKVAFFDADIYFQKDVNLIFDLMSDDAIYLNHESNVINDSAYMIDWIDFSKSKISIKAFNLIEIDNNLIYCTGFFGAKTDVFLKITNMAVLLSTNRILPFHNDQPLMNILVHTYKYPFLELGDDLIHLAHTKEEELSFENNTFTVKNRIPAAIHYHGKHREFVKSKLIEDYKPKGYKNTTLGKIKFKINKIIKS